MASPLRPTNMSPELRRVAERARDEPDGKFHSIAHLLNEEALKRAYGRLRGSAAVGVDGVTKEEYGRNLEGNPRELVGRMKRNQYRHQPIRRVRIPKEKGKDRELGISCTEDKIVQGALAELLGTIYEEDFIPHSYGFRRGRSPHDAIRALNRAVEGEEVGAVLEGDIKSFFDTVDRRRLQEMIQHRIPDGRIKRLIGKCLHVGILDGEEFSRPDEGVVQGSALSPLLGNLYLHYVLDLWFERKVKPRLRGNAQLIRYADDWVIFFEDPQEAEQVKTEMLQRLAEFGLCAHPDKTSVVLFKRPGKDHSGGRHETFDFLGFTVYWRRSRRGNWRVAFRTRGARLRRATKGVNDWCRDHRHQSLTEQHRMLKSKLRGHYNYYGVNGNIESVQTLLYQATRYWFKWLNRRSQRRSYKWEGFKQLLAEAFPLPKPRIMVQIWGTSP